MQRIFYQFGECVISCNCYLIWRILYPRKGKCDQWQDCYQLQHPHLIWRIYLSDPQFKPFILDLLNIFFALTWWIFGIFVSLESYLKIQMICIIESMRLVLKIVVINMESCNAQSFDMEDIMNIFITWE